GWRKYPRSEELPFQTEESLAVKFPQLFSSSAPQVSVVLPDRYPQAYSQSHSVKSPSCWTKRSPKIFVREMRGSAPGSRTYSRCADLPEAPYIYSARTRMRNSASPRCLRFPASSKARSTLCFRLSARKNSDPTNTSLRQSLKHRRRQQGHTMKS